MIDWGSVPDWFAGAGAVAALYFAFRAAKAVRKQNEQQSEQLKLLTEEAQERADHNRKAQASKVTLMILENGPPVDDEDLTSAAQLVREGLSDEDRAFFDSLYILNRSDDPIYMVQIHAGKIFIGYSAIPPSDKPERLANTASVHFRGDWKPVSRARKLFGESLSGVVFTDAEGRHWSRALNGPLKPEQDGVIYHFWARWKDLTDDEYDSPEQEGGRSHDSNG